MSSEHAAAANSVRQAANRQRSEARVRSKPHHRQLRRIGNRSHAHLINSPDQTAHHRQSAHAGSRHAWNREQKNQQGDNTCACGDNNQTAQNRC